jgi:hypothetical protein
MPDSETRRSAALNSILGSEDEKPNKGFTIAGAGEQAFSLRADYKDGRRKRGIAWSRYSDYEWEDLGDHERLVVIFEDRILTLEGHNLDLLARQIDEGKLKTFEEEITARVVQARNDPSHIEPVVISVDFYPKIADIVTQIKGGEEDDHHRHVRRVAGR